MGAYMDYINAARESGDPEKYVQENISPVEMSSMISRLDTPTEQTHNVAPVNNALADYVAPRANVNYASEYYKAGQAARNNASSGSIGSAVSGGSNAQGGTNGNQIEYSDAFIKQEQMKDAYSPYQNYNEGYLASIMQGKGAPKTGDDNSFLSGAIAKIIEGDNGTQSSDDAPAWTQTPEYQELERLRRIDDINRHGQLTTDYYSKMLDQMQTQPQTAGTESTRTELPQDYVDALERRAVGNSAYRSTLRDRPYANISTDGSQKQNNYRNQFQADIAALQKQFPNYGYSALADMVMFNEEMRNGQSSYYKWLANNFS